MRAIQSTRRLGLVLVVALALLAAGCDNPYGACVRASDDVANSVTQGYVTTTQLYQQRLLTQGEALNVAGYLKFTNDANKTFQTCVEAAHTQSKVGAFSACVTSFTTSLNQPNETSLIQVSNPNAQTTVNNIANAFVTGLNNLLAALGGA